MSEKLQIGLKKKTRHSFFFFGLKKKKLEIGFCLKLDCAVKSNFTIAKTLNKKELQLFAKKASKSFDPETARKTKKNEYTFEPNLKMQKMLP